MGLNDILVYVDSTEATKARVGFAVALAKEHGAHLIGIAFAPTALLPLYGADVGEFGSTPITFVLTNTALVTVRYATPKAFSVFGVRAS